MKQEELAKFTLPIKDLGKKDYGYANIEYLIQMGATIEERHYNRYNKHFIAITLPLGYTIGEEIINGNFKQRDIYDESNNKRGSYFIKTDDLSTGGLCLMTKYQVTSDRYSVGENKFCKVFFGNSEEELIVEGILPITVHDRSQLFIQSQLANLKESCKAKADLLYPDWQNPLAYWDETLKQSDEQVLSRVKNED